MGGCQSIHCNHSAKKCQKYRSSKFSPAQLKLQTDQTESEKDKTLQQDSKKLYKLIRQYECDPKWKKLHSNKINVYSLQVASGAAVKVQVIVNISIQKIQHFLADVQATKHMNSMCIEARALHEEPQFRILYNRFKGKGPASGRDFVLITNEHIDNGKVYQSARSYNYQNFPKVQKTIRAQIYLGGWILEKINDDSTQVTYISHTDIGGSVPEFAKKSIAEDEKRMVDRLESTIQKYYQQ